MLAQHMMPKKDWKSAIEIQKSWYQSFFFKALWQDYPAVSIE